MKAGWFLALSALGALGATAAGWVGAPPTVLACALAVAFIALACAAGETAVRLRAPDDLEEPRQARGPTHPAPLPPEGVTRSVFGRMWAVALGAFAVLGFVPLVSLARNPGRRDLSGWKAGVRLVDASNAPVRADRLDEGGVATVFPENGIELPDAPAVLIRLANGYVAYSKICTHAGCPVALYRRQAQELYCPCHQSRFDVLHGARNVSGPAPRPLPQLPVAVDAHGYLIATGDFDAPVGPDDWYRTP